MSKMSETNGINSIIQSEAANQHFNSLIEEFHRYFPGVEHDTSIMALTWNPFRVYVEDFLIEQNEDEGIPKEFLDMIHDSSLKASFEDENLENFWEMTEKPYQKLYKNHYF